MQCPACDDHFQPDDYHDDEPFECPLCGALVRIVTDEDAYTGAAQKSLELVRDS